MSDAESPFNGKNIPDLRGMFVLGTAQGASPTLGTVTGQAHTNINGPTNAAALSTGPTQAIAADDVTNNIIQSHSPSTSWRYVLTSDLSIQDGNHHHVVDAGGLALSPPGSVAMYYIIRFK